MAEAALLALQGVSAGYGETVVLETLNFRIGAGESVSFIGRNGVGKSTLLATIMGHTTLHAGAVIFAGRPVEREPTHRRVRTGLGYVPQEREIFPSLTVRENLMVAARPGNWTLERVYGLFPRLAERQRSRGDRLSGGEQQMLAIARALMGNPRLVLMDEPSEGLAPVVVDELQRAIARLRDEQELTIVLVEQKVDFALDFSSRCVAMDRGRFVFDGDSQALRDDPELLETLVGVKRT